MNICIRCNDDTMNATFCSYKCMGKYNRGRKQSAEWIAKRTLSRKLNYTAEKRILASERRKGKLNPMYGRKGILYKNTGKRRTLLQRQNISKKTKEAMTPEICKIVSERTRLAMTLEVINKIKLARLHQIIPIKDTSIEIKIQTLLTNLQIKYNTHYPIFGQPDLFIEPNICIFCDGDYWHNLPNRKIRDNIVNNKLISLGYVVLRFWEHDIHNNFEIVQADILKHIQVRNV